MATNLIEITAVVVGAVFLSGMVVGVVLMIASAIVRRRGSVVAARLLLSGPPGVLCASAIYLLAVDFFPIGLRVPLIAVFLATAVPIFFVVLRARISFAPIGRPRD
jgi:hypothetical protein